MSRQPEIERMLRQLEPLRDLTRGVVHAVAGRLTIRTRESSGLSIEREALGVAAGEGLAVDREGLHNRLAIDFAGSSAMPLPGTLCLVNTTATAVFAMLPTLQTTPEGSIVRVKIRAGANTCTISPAASDEIEGSSSLVFSGVGEVRTLVASPRDRQWYAI